MSGDRQSVGAEGVISRAGMVVVRCRTYADSAVPHQDRVAFIIGVRRLRSDVLGVVLVVCSNFTIDLGYTVPSSVRQCPIAQLERPTRRRARGPRVAPVVADDAQPRSVSVSRVPSGLSYDEARRGLYALGRIARAV